MPTTGVSIAYHDVPLTSGRPPSRLRNDFAHLALGVDFGLAEPSIVASPMYTLVDRKAVTGQGNAWKWRYKGRFVDGTESQWLSEEEARDSFTPLQQDVFHALWETYHGTECQKRSTSTLTRKERAWIHRERTLKQHPVGTVIWREFADAEGNKKRYLSKVFDYKSPYWRVWYADGDWEELHEREILKGRNSAIRFPVNEQREVEFDGEREKTLAEDRPASKIKVSAYPGYWEKQGSGGKEAFSWCA